MTTPVSQITIDDGTTSVDVDGYATLNLIQALEPIAGGSSTTRFLDGTAIKQTHWPNQKWRVRISAEGWAPSGLKNLNYKVQQTWTIVTQAGTEQRTVFATPPRERFNVNAARHEWSLVGEEV